MSANQCLNIASACVKAFEMVTESWPEATADDIKAVAQHIIVHAPMLVMTDRCVENNAMRLIDNLAHKQLIPAWVG